MTCARARRRGQRPSPIPCPIVPALARGIKGVVRARGVHHGDFGSAGEPRAGVARASAARFHQRETHSMNTVAPLRGVSSPKNRKSRFSESGHEATTLSSC